MGEYVSNDYNLYPWIKNWLPQFRFWYLLWPLCREDQKNEKIRNITTLWPRFYTRFGHLEFGDKIGVWDKFDVNLLYKEQIGWKALRIYQGFGINLTDLKSRLWCTYWLASTGTLFQLSIFRRKTNSNSFHFHSKTFISAIWSVWSVVPKVGVAAVFY